MNRSLALVTIAVLASTSAFAQKRLAVVDLATPPTMTGLGAQVTQNILTTAQGQGYAVTAPDAVRAQLGEQRYGELLQCNGKPACVAAKVNGLAADRVVVGSLNRDDRNYLVKLWLIDVANGTEISDVDRSILIASRRLAQDVSDAVPGLLRGEKEAKGKLTINADAKNVEITIDGEPVGKTPLTVELKPGKHELKAEKKAYYPVSRYVTVSASEAGTEQLRMVRIPGQVSEDDVVPELPQAQRQVAQAPAGTGLPRESVMLGAAALILAGGGVGFLVDTNKALDAQGDAYRETRQYKDDRLLSTGLFVGAGAAALGAVLVGLFVDGDDKPAVAPAATAGGGGGFVVTGRF